MKKTVAVLLVALLVLGLVATSLSALSLLGSDERDVERSARPDVARDGTLKPFWEQEIDWAGCGDGVECGWLRVPLEHEDPDGARIDIALVKALARKPEKKLGTIVVNPGGPGAPGTEMAAQIDWTFDRALTDVYDVVGFDPRGTGVSAPLDCLTDDELSEFIAVEGGGTQAEELAETERRNQAFADGCRSRSGALVDHVSTVDVAQDMDILRAAMGEEKLDFYGASYGTKIGAIYADLFPEQVGRFVLDAAMDPASGAVESALTQAEGVETALAAFVEDCQEKKRCPLPASGERTVERGLAAVSDVLADLEREPLTVGRRTLTAGEGFYGIISALYVDDYWPLLRSALTSLEKGEGAELLALADGYTGRRADGSYSDNSMEAIGVISCLDDPTSLSAAQVSDLLPRFARVAPTVGEEFAWGLTSCGSFDFEPNPPSEVKAAGADPILVTGTTRDPATPMVWAERLADQLESGVLIRRDGDGHGAYGMGSDCVDDAVEAYFLRGEVPRDGLSC